MDCSSLNETLNQRHGHTCFELWYVQVIQWPEKKTQCHIGCHTPTSRTPSSQLGASTEAPFFGPTALQGSQIGPSARLRAARTRWSRYSSAARWPPSRSSVPRPSLHGAEPHWQHPLLQGQLLGRGDATLRPRAPEAELTRRKGIGRLEVQWLTDRNAQRDYSRMLRITPKWLEHRTHRPTQRRLTKQRDRPVGQSRTAVADLDSGCSRPNPDISTATLSHARWKRDTNGSTHPKTKKCNPSECPPNKHLNFRSSIITAFVGQSWKAAFVFQQFCHSHPTWICASITHNNTFSSCSIKKDPGSSEILLDVVSKRTPYSPRVSWWKWPSFLWNYAMCLLIRAWHTQIYQIFSPKLSL